MIAGAYGAEFERYAARLPKAEAQRRRAQFDRFLASGFPGPASEAWHYTDLAPLADRAYRLAEADDRQPLDEALPGTDRLIYRNGVPANGSDSGARWLGMAGARSGGDDGVDALNAAFADSGLALRLARGECLERPLHVLLQSHAGRDATMIHQLHRIELAERAQATVLLQFTGAGGERLGTHRIEIVLAAGASLRLYRLGGETDGATLVTRIDAQLQRDSRLRLATVDVGAGLARHECTVTLAGSGAEVELSALYVPKAGGHVDNLARIVHAAPHCRSRLHCRGIIDERAKAVLVGKVVVQPGAQKTDSEQRIANLLLSKRAEINAKPELEIYADDVKCAHGATVGQLDERALAYLRSRGIAREDARALLLRAFAGAILDPLDWAELRERIAASLHLPALAEQETLDFEDAA